MEHIVPRCAGGDTALGNLALALACQGCNSHKYTMTHAPDPVTRAVVALYHPRRDRWSGHFCWSPDCTRVLGLTPTGRATVATLKLNRERLTNLRRVLHAVGQHPPVELDERQLG